MSSNADDAPTQALDAIEIRAHLRVGTTLRDKWQLDVLLGVGGMASVYAATHRNGSRAAVKILHPELSINAELRSRFLREGYLANSVGHEGAVKILDDDVADDSSLYLVTELLDGETLEARRLRFGGQLTESEVLLAADQILDVLVAAHAKGIVHRDIKPENVFLMRTGQVKVLDFGIARLRQLSSLSTSTKAGMTLGTPSFMAPEQARGLWDEVDGRSDVWACGATMFLLLSGSSVHRGRTPNELLLSAMTMRAPPCASAVLHAGAGIARVIDRALAFEREGRWPDARSMQRAVREAYGERYGAIATGPKLVVPVQVPDRTLPSAGGAPAGRISTERPVETPAQNAGAAGASATTALFARGWMALALGGAALLGAALTGGVWMTVARTNAMGDARSRAELPVVSAWPRASEATSAETVSPAAPAAPDLRHEALVPAEAPHELTIGDALATADAGTKPAFGRPKPASEPAPKPVGSAPFGYKSDVPY